jgi:hypothetical protein
MGHKFDLWKWAIESAIQFHMLSNRSASRIRFNSKDPNRPSVNLLFIMNLYFFLCVMIILEGFIFYVFPNLWL